MTTPPATPSRTDVVPHLLVNNIEVVYDHVILVLKGVSLEVPTGKMVALLGANGAGKSTTLKAISNLLKAERGAVTKGTIEYRGQRVDRLGTDDLVGLGVCQVMEGRHCFPHLTVEENLLTGAFARRASGKGLKDDLNKVYHYFPRLKQRRSSQAGYTSGGEQQMIAVGRALMAAPSLVLLDEPSMGLAPLMVQKVFETIIAVAREGVTILLVEQNAKLALEVSRRGYVMESGTITLAGAAQTLLHDPKVRAAYLGEAA